MARATQRPYNIPDGDLDPEDPFYSLFLKNPDLPRLRYHPTHTRCWYNPWESEHRDYHTSNGLEQLLEQSGMDTHQEQSFVGIILIEEIDNLAISILKRMFPDLDLEFILEHVIRIIAPNSPSPKGTRMTKWLDGGDEIYTDKSEATFGSHFDGFLSQVDLLTGDGHDVKSSNGGTKVSVTFHENRSSHLLLYSRYRQETFISDGSTWNRTSTRISCCALRPGICKYVK